VKKQLLPFGCVWSFVCLTFQESSKWTFQKTSNLEENWKADLEPFWKLAELEENWKSDFPRSGSTLLFNQSEWRCPPREKK